MPEDVHPPFSTPFSGGWTRVAPPPPRADLGPGLFAEPPLPPRLAELKRWWREHPLPPDSPADPGRRARDFFRQARLMADFEDDFDRTAPFHRYWPAYRDMDDAQLRTYFTFRARVRRGEAPPVPLSYVFVLAYELLAQIGAARPADALARLDALETAYAARHPALAAHLARWKRDFAVHCNLSSAVDAVFAPERAADRDLAVLADAATADDETLFAAACRSGGFDPARSAGARAAPERFRAVVCRTLRALAKSRTFFFSACLRLKPRCDRWNLFAGALVLRRAPQPDHVFAIDAVRRFRFEAGECFCIRFPDRDLAPGRARGLGDLLRECDRRMRLAWRLPGALKERTLPPGAAAAIARAIEGERAEEARTEAAERAVKIDFAALEGIRRDAEATREALLAEDGEATEGMGEEEVPAPAPPAAPPAEEPPGGPVPPPAPEAAEGTALPEPHRAFLAAVLAGTGWKECARAAGQPAEVLADAINARALDETGDILLDAGDEGPRVIEDYLPFARRLAGLSGN